MSAIAINIILIGYFCSIGWTQHVPQVEVEPGDTLVSEGDAFHFVCRVRRPIQSCKVELPSGRSANLIPNIQISGFEYFGSGLQFGECGLRVLRAEMSSSGNYKCFLTLGDGSNDVLQGQMTVNIATAPETPDLRMFKRNQLYNVGDILRANCVVRNGKPASNISWFMGDDIIYNGLEAPEIYSSLDNSQGLQTVSQNFSKTLTWRDHGKKLRCVANHFANKTPQSSQVEIHVKFRPQPSEKNPIILSGFREGGEGVVTYIVAANPQPKIRWYVDGRDVSQKVIVDDVGDDELMLNYVIEKIKQVEPGRWEARLRINQVTADVFRKDFRLNASNELGIQVYIIKITS